MAKQLRSAADAHHLASRVLDDYAETLAELGELAEAACREAAGELAALRPVLPEHAVAVAAPVPAVGGPPLLPPPPVRRGGPAPGPEPEEPVDPRLGDVDRVAYRDNLQDLCDAVLDHLTGR
ncbi:hypothetical protein [Amycolatopsis sp. lyj-346]|uniref:hypothetical protein n=1 Tax=Amycolatopsis sp. lyj-346 TaxID=2789289 RepID=UPI00397808B8